MRKKILLGIFVLVAVVLVSQAKHIAQISPILFQLIFHRNIDLKKTDHTINILGLGVGGGTHEGPNLTDTIIFVSINTEQNKVNLVSIPRDLWIPELNGKINTAYAIGEEKRDGGGFILAKAVVSKVVNQKIDYAIKVDFEGFIKAVDLVGGLDIDVEQSFNDYLYPIGENREDLCGHTLEEATALIATQEAQIVFPCRYQHIRFDKGFQHVDGMVALKFVRSRYAIGSEGSDFARSKRQEKVIVAFKDKVFSAETVLNPAKMIYLYGILKDSIETDAKEEEFDDFIRLVQKIKNTTIQSIVIDNGDEKTNRAGLLINPPIGKEYEMQWVLIPRAGNGNFSEIHEFVSCMITVGECELKSFITPTITSGKQR